MTRLQKLALSGATAALLMTGAASKSFAIESGAFQYLAGATIGLPLGAAPPPGVYTGFTAAYGLYGQMTGNQGAAVGGGTKGLGLGSFIGVVPVVWATGWNFLGASYNVAVIQPFVTAFVGTGGGLLGTVNANTTCASPPLGANTCAWQSMFINTVWQPLDLSWNLGGGWFASVYFSFQAPTGTKVVGIANPDFWTFSPGAAISYLSANWNATANLVYNVYTASQGIAMNLGAAGGGAFGSGYVSGNQIAGDLHALYKLGKWSFGPVGYFVAQTTPDRAGGAGCAALAAAAPGLACANQTFFGVGGLVGYDFGPVDLQVWVTDTVAQQNTGESGVIVWTRMGFRLWAPEAPRPLVAKN
jgi:hypothetical protein